MKDTRNIFEPKENNTKVSANILSKTVFVIQVVIQVVFVPRRIFVSRCVAMTSQSLSSLISRSPLTSSSFLSSESPLHISGHPFARSHCSTSRCPPSAALQHVHSSHGQPFARAHFSTSSCPPAAANWHVHSFQGQPFARNHLSTSSRLPNVTSAHLCASENRQPSACSHCSTSRCPFSAAAA